jgi:hypothetical protein
MVEGEQMESNPSSAVLNRLGWQVFGASVKGNSHQLKGLPNQDDIYWQTKSGRGTENLLVLAVADGHGSEKYLRSDAGARIATRIAVEVTEDFIKNLDPETINSGASISRIAKHELPPKIVQRWREMVNKHLTENPLTDLELEKLSESQKNEVKGNELLTYGATLLTVAITENFILYLQLGDGDILTVTEDGAVSSPLPDDPQAFADRTPSLCSDNSWRNFRVTYRPTLDDLPALILLTTDGYRNSFDSSEGFKAIGSYILDMLRENGISRVQGELEVWLNETTKRGSGDDITLGAIFRFAQTSSAVESPVTDKEKVKSSVADAEKEVEIDPSAVLIVSENIPLAVSEDAPTAGTITSPFAASDESEFAVSAEAEIKESSGSMSQETAEPHISKENDSEQSIVGEPTDDEPSATVNGEAQGQLPDMNPDVNQNLNPDVNLDTEAVIDTGNPVSTEKTPPNLQSNEADEKSDGSRDTSRIAAMSKYFKDKLPKSIKEVIDNRESE